jgi:hypothetical protein
MPAELLNRLACFLYLYTERLSDVTSSNHRRN